VPVILVNKVVDKKRIIEKIEEMKRRRGTTSPQNNAHTHQHQHVADNG
jgi:hypothetical protein